MAEKIKDGAQDDIYEIVRGISQAASMAYDGSSYGEDKDNKIGLRREEGNYLTDKRIMDGFKVKVGGRKMTINYHVEVSLQEISKLGPSKFEGEIEDMIERCLAFIKKQYKKITGKTLSVKESKRTTKSGKVQNDFDVSIQPVSRVRTSVTAHKCYELSSIPEEEEYKSEVIDQYEKYNKNIFKNKKAAESSPKRIA